MIKRITTLVFVFLTIVGNAVWGQTFSGGNGTETEPYKIASKVDLESLATTVNSGTNYAGKYFELTTDIDLGGSVDKQWTPIGTFDNPFAGIFEGGGNTISNLYISSSKGVIGLFGCVATGAIIENIVLKNFQIKGKSNVGAVVGRTADGAHATIKNCTLKNSKIECSQESSDFAMSAFIGGIAGQFTGNIEYCTVEADCEITNTQTEVGGIAGRLYDSEAFTSCLKYCINKGTVKGSSYVGGIVGVSYVNIENCENYGSIQSSQSGNVGGIAGSIDSRESPTIQNCKNYGDVVAMQNSAGGIIGTAYGQINNCVNYGKVSTTWYAGGTGGIVGGNYANITSCISIGIIQKNTQGTNVRGGIVGKNISSPTISSSYCFVGKDTELNAIGNQNSATNYDAYEIRDGIGEDGTVVEPTTDGVNFTFKIEVEEGKAVQSVALSNGGTVTDNGDGTYSFAIAQEESVTITATIGDESEEEPDQPGDNDDQGDTGIDKPQRPIKYYNIYVDTICPGLNVEVSKDVVQEGHQVSAYLTIQAECDTTGMRFEYKRGLFGYWKDLKELEGVQPGEYIIKNIYTDIYIRALDATLPEEEPTGIEDVEGVKAYAKEGSIYVYTPSREEVTIISMSGAIIKHEEQVGLQSYSVSRGIYIIRIGEKVFKLKN